MSLIGQIQEYIEDRTGAEITVRQVLLLFVVIFLAIIVIYMVANDPI